MLKARQYLTIEGLTINCADEEGDRLRKLFSEMATLPEVVKHETPVPKAIKFPSRKIEPG